LHNSQFELEQSLITDGKNNYLARASKNNTQTQFNIINKCHEHLSSEIIKQLRNAVDGKALSSNITADGIKLLLDITPDIATALTLRTVLNSIDKPIPLTQLAFSLANELITQHKFTHIITEKSIKHLDMDNMIEFQYERDNKLTKRVDEFIDRKQLGYTNLTQTDKSRLGLFLLNVLEQIGIITIKTVLIGAKRHQYQVKPSLLLTQYMNDYHEHMSSIHPLRQPMIEKPKDWVSLYDSGGYHCIQNNFVRGANKTQFDALKQANLTNVFNAVNRLQSVRWRIDKPMLELINTITVNCPDICESTRFMDVIEMREYPKEGTEQEQSQWRFEAYLTATKNQSNFSKKTRFLKTLSIVSKYKDYETIYFPYNLDKRGRSYPIPSIFNPQSDDISKSLLLLKPQAVTENGEYWLKVNIANLFGMDKLDFDARIAWFDRHLDEILQDPLDGSRLWCKADSPLSFLQASLDYKNYLETGLSSVVVRVDATNSAIQHIAALTRDEELAKFTNMSKSNTFRHDFYQTVASILQSNVDNDDSDDEADKRFIRDWQAKISRKLIKPSVMTSPFNVSPRGIQRQLIDYVKTHTTPTKAFIHHDSRIVIESCSWLQKKLTRTLSKSFPQLNGMRKILRDKARLIARTDESPQWLLPSGFLFTQHDNKYDSKRIIFRYNEKKVSLRVNGINDEAHIDANKQANSVTANLIHSLDGCHVHMVSNDVDFEITTIHDSIGCHCNNVDTLQLSIRKQFVKLHSDFDINSIFSDMDDIELGAFDINEVMVNPYFFS